MFIYSSRADPDIFSHILFGYFRINLNQFYYFPLTFYQPIYQPIYQPTLSNNFFRCRKCHTNKIPHKPKAFLSITLQNPWHSRPKLLHQFQIPIHAHQFPIPWNGNPIKKIIFIEALRQSACRSDFNTVGKNLEFGWHLTGKVVMHNRIYHGLADGHRIPKPAVYPFFGRNLRAVRFSNSILSNTLFVAFMSEQ